MTKEELLNMWVVSYDVKDNLFEIASVQSWLQQNVELYARKRTTACLVIDILPSRAEALTRARELEMKQA